MKKQIIPTNKLPAIFTTETSRLDRKTLKKKLQVLERATERNFIHVIVCCYSPLAPELPSQTSFICPKCGEKTIYSIADKGVNQVSDAGRLRRKIKVLRAKGIAVFLDESAFCTRCGKDSKFKEFVLEVKWPDQAKPHRVTLEGTTDLQIISEFLDGKLEHDGGREGREPLRDYLPRLRELLGLETEPDLFKKPSKKRTP